MFEGKQWLCGDLFRLSIGSASLGLPFMADRAADVFRLCTPTTTNHVRHSANIPGFTVPSHLNTNMNCRRETVHMGVQPEGRLRNADLEVGNPAEGKGLRRIIADQD
jgi:hypothetical protein